MRVAEDIEILVLTWNRADLLREALSSICRQTVLPWRVTVMDNASEDGTVALVESLAREYPFVRLLRQPVHVDVRANIATAVGSVERKWFLMMHDDDILDRNFIAAVDAAIRQEPDATMVCTCHRQFSDASEVHDEYLDSVEYESYANKVGFVAADLARFSLAQKESLCFPSTVYRRDCVNLPAFDIERIGKIADRPFVYGSAGGGKVLRIVNPLYKYRVHKGQDTATSSNGPYPGQILNLLDYTLGMLAAEPRQLADFRKISVRFLKSLYCWGGNDMHKWREFVCTARERGIVSSCSAKPWQIPLWRQYADFVLRRMLKRAAARKATAPLAVGEPMRNPAPAGTTDEKLVSVVVPVYNGEKHLSFALESLRCQTYPNFEAICINDGGTDGSVEIIKRFADGDPRFRLIEQKNRGVAATRNRAIAEAKGGYVTFLDQDDALAPDALSHLVDALEKSRCEVAVAGIGEFTDDGEIPVPKPQPEEELRISDTPLNDFFGFNGKLKYGVSVWAKMYRRGAVDGVCFPDGVYGADDYVFSARICSRIKSYAVVPEPLYQYRMHPGNVTMRMPADYILGVLRSREIVWRELCANPAIGAEMRSRISADFSYDIMSWAIKKTCRKQYAEAEMAAIRDYAKRLLQNGVLKPSGLLNRLKLRFFLRRNRFLMRLFFPAQFKVKAVQKQK